MKLRVLGCSGGIGGRHLRTTSFLLDSDVLIDAGTGVGDLSLAELSLIDHIFVTHSHLDHVAEIPTPEAPFLRYQEITLGEALKLGGRTITPIPARHTVPAVGYHLDSGAASLVFTGDTGPNDALWRTVNRIPNLKYLIIETAFSNKERQLAEVSRHLCPETLAQELAKLERSPEIYVTHLKPGEIELTMQEIEECAGAFRPRMLQNNLVLEF